MTQASATDALFDMLSSVAPALVDLTRKHVVDELWSRPRLIPGPAPSLSRNPP